MSNKKHNGITIHGNAGVPYRVFAFSYVINDKYNLSVYSGDNMRTGSKVTIIPFELADQDIFENRLQYFRKRGDLHWVDSSTRDKTNYVIFDVLPSEFENIYLNLPVESVSQNTEKNDTDNSQVIASTQNDKKHKINKQKEKNRSNPKGIWIGALLLIVVCGVGTYFVPKLFAQYPQPTNTNEIVPTASFTLLPAITETYTQSSLITDTVVPPPTATNTTVQITLLPNTLTLTPSIVPPSDTLTSTPSITATIGTTRTETVTIVPTRTGLANELNLCAIESTGAKIRSLPSRTSDHLEYLGFRQCLWFNARVEINKNETWVHITPNQFLINGINVVGGWIRSDLVTKGNLTTLELITSEPEVGYVILPTSTPTSTPIPTATSTPAITPTP